MDNFSPITELLSKPRAASHIVSYVNGEDQSWAVFTKKITSAAEFFKQSSSSIWGLYVEDSFDFAVLLFALWQADKDVVLLKDNLASTLLEVASSVDALLVDPLVDAIPSEAFNVDEIRGECIKPEIVFQFAPQRQRAIEQLKPLGLNTVALSVYTSGSTGNPKKIPIKFFQFSNEIIAHEQRWGGDLANSIVVSTASHQHLYGLIFKVLWPLCAGRAFVSDNKEYVEDLIACATKHKFVNVVSTPSHLGRLPESIPWDNYYTNWAAIFSSAAPLAKTQSIAAKNKFSVGITEVYGSSETGGIAWRRQDTASGEVWQLFEGIEALQDNETQVLKIDSSFMDCDGFYETTDKISLVGERAFKLLGRVDRVAKVEGKRVSLDAIENSLEASLYVDQVKIIVRSEKRVVTCAVLTLSNEGREILLEKGKFGLVSMLKQKLKAGFESVVIPRKWRIVESLPCDAQGKISQQRLQALFESNNEQ